MSFAYDDAAHLPHPALSFAAWVEMCGERYVPGKAPPALRPAQAAFERLSADEAALARALGKRVWSHVSKAVFDVADPLDVGSARERAVHDELRRELPFLDSWTFGVLWNVAFTHAMM